MEHHDVDAAKSFMDGLSIFTVVGALADMLPAFASLVTIVWLSIRIWETDTVRGWFKKPALDVDSDAKQ
jgi:hypothetical protein